jgi:hypothetical protein
VFATPDEGCWGRVTTDSGLQEFSRLAQTPDEHQDWVTNPEFAEVLKDYGAAPDVVNKFFVLKTTEDVEVAADPLSTKGRLSCRIPATARKLYMRRTDPYEFSFRDEELALEASKVVNTTIVDTVLLMAFNLVEGLNTFANLGIPLNYITGATIVASGSVFKFTQLNCAGATKHRQMCDHGLPLPPFAERLHTFSMLPPEVLVRRAAKQEPRTISSTDMAKGDVFMLGKILRMFLDAAHANPGKFVIINKDMVKTISDTVDKMTAEDPAHRLAAPVVFLRFEKALGISVADSTWKKLGDGSYGCVGEVDGLYGRPKRATKLFYEDLRRVTPDSSKLEATREAEEAAFIERLDPSHAFTFEQYTRTYPKVVRRDRFDVSKCRAHATLGAHVLSTQTGAGTVSMVHNPVEDITGFIVALRGLFQGLHAFREVGYMHRDISARNIVLDPAKGAYKFIDFGMGGVDQYKAYLGHENVALYLQWPPEFIAHAYTVPKRRSLTCEEVLKQYASYLICGFINVDPCTGNQRQNFKHGKALRYTRDQVLARINETGVELHGREWVIDTGELDLPPVTSFSTASRKCNVVSLLRDDTPQPFQLVAVNGFRKILRSPEVMAAPLSPALADLVSLGDVWGLGVSIMDTLVTDPGLYSVKDTTPFYNIFTLARLMIEVDPSLRITAAEARTCLDEIVKDADKPVMSDFLAAKRAMGPRR